jgi:hypothetical protein
MGTPEAETPHLTKLLCVTLRPQPSDTAVAIHPLVYFGFAFETRNVNRLDTRAFGPDIPVVLGNSYRFETYSCFRHCLLWQINELKSKGVVPRDGRDERPFLTQSGHSATADVS